MMDSVVVLLVCSNIVMATLAGYYACCAINRMGRDTDPWVRWSYVAKAGGAACQVAGGFDFIAGTSIAWPWLLLAGVVAWNGGVTGIFFAGRRRCDCQDCAMRKPHPIKIHTKETT